MQLQPAGRLRELQQPQVLAAQLAQTRRWWQPLTQLGPLQRRHQPLLLQPRGVAERHAQAVLRQRGAPAAAEALAGAAPPRAVPAVLARATPP
eukprot:414417-Alexandrium_andersonii.AAC.1